MLRVDVMTKASGYNGALALQKTDDAGKFDSVELWECHHGHPDYPAAQACASAELERRLELKRGVAAEVGS